MTGKEIHFRIRRQDGHEAAAYWEEFKMPYSPAHNVVSALMYLREHPVNVEGKTVPPVTWDCNCLEEVCGACSMLVNGTYTGRPPSLASVNRLMPAKLRS